MIWNDWLVPATRQLTYASFRHVEYVEVAARRSIVQEPLTHLVHAYHTKSGTDLNLLITLGYPLTAQAMLGDQRPTNSEVRRGHLAEILACEYAHHKMGFEVPVHRLQYNPNPDQSMKGDDVLGFYLPPDLKSDCAVLVGEAKYRSDFSSQAVLEAYEALCRGFRPYPASLEFAVTLLRMQGSRAKAERIEQVKQMLLSHSKQAHRTYLLLIATEGQPRDPFRCLEDDPIRLHNLIAVNIAFAPGIGDWIDRIYQGPIH